MKTKRDISHILIIDDDEFLLNSIRKKLYVTGHKVTISNNIHDAYFKLSIVRPDLILLDVILPEMNGVEFMGLINSRFNPSGLPIVLMSYLPKKELFKMGYSIGNAYYLTKPFNVNHLPFTLDKILLNHKTKLDVIH